MSNLNTLVTRWENGGVLLFDTDTVLNIEPGTLKVMHPLRERIKIPDRGVISSVVEGDLGTGTLEFSVRGDVTATTSLFRAVQAAGTSGAPKAHTLVIKIPNYPGAAAGVSITCTGWWLTEGPTWEAGGSGQNVDKVGPFKFEGSAVPTYSTY